MNQQLNQEAWHEVDILECDFEAETLTFSLPKNFEVFAGKYQIRQASIQSSSERGGDCE